VPNKHGVLHRVHVLSQLGRGGEVVVHHPVHDRVEHGGRPQRQPLGVGPPTGGAAHAAHRAHRDDVVPAQEDRDLAGVHDLDVGVRLIRVHVLHGLQHGEGHVVVPVQLRSLVSRDRILDGQRMQVETLGQGGELGLHRLVQADPDEAALVPAHPRDRRERRTRPRPAAAVDVHGRVDYVVRSSGLGQRPGRQGAAARWGSVDIGDNSSSAAVGWRTRPRMEVARSWSAVRRPVGDPRIRDAAGTAR